MLEQLPAPDAAGMCEHAVPVEGNPAAAVRRIYFFPLGDNWWGHPDPQSSVPEPCMLEFGTHY